jgi:hypothetical protein
MSSCIRIQIDLTRFSKYVRANHLGGGGGMTVPGGGGGGICVIG